MGIVRLENEGLRGAEMVAGCVRDGGVLIYPTDTVYGLGCDPFNENALSRIVAIKGRDSGKGMLLLVPDHEWLSELTVDLDNEQKDICRRVWPGPVTLLFEASSRLPRLVTGRGGKVGIRMPGNRFLIDCLNRIPGPLVSTSANLSGHPAVSKFADLDPSIIGKVDLAVDGGAEFSGPIRPSSVIDLSGKEPLLVRKGEGMEKIKTLGVL